MSGQDFVPGDLQVTFLAGTTSDVCSDVTIIDDGHLEGDHSFTVVITGISPGSGSSTPISSTTILIHDNHGEQGAH